MMEIDTPNFSELKSTYSKRNKYYPININNESSDFIKTFKKILMPYNKSF